MWTPRRTKNKTCQRADELPASQRPSTPGEEIGAARLFAYCNTHDMTQHSNLMPDRTRPGKTTAALPFGPPRGGSDK